MEQLYLATPTDTPAQQAFNEQLVMMLDGYGFPLFVPQEQLNGKDMPKSDTLSPPLQEGLDRCTMVLAILDNTANSPTMKAQLNYAKQKQLKILGLRIPHPDTQSYPELPPDIVKNCIKVIDMPEDFDELVHPLVSHLNLHFL